MTLRSLAGSLRRCVSTTRILPPRRDWRTAGHPPPPSILDDTPDPVDLTEDNDLVNSTRPATPPLHRRTPPPHPTPHEHAAHSQAIRKAFPSGWSPPRKLSREAMDGLRQLHRADPTAFSTPILAERFRISPEAVRRILKSRWEPTREQRALFAEKERLRRSAFIRTSRMKERIQAMELEQITGPRDGRGDRVRGADGKDRLTFQ